MRGHFSLATLEDRFPERGIGTAGGFRMMIEDRVGSITPGKDADIGLWTGDPVDPRSSCEMTMINGRIEYDASEERRF